MSWLTDRQDKRNQKREALAGQAWLGGKTGGLSSYGEFKPGGSKEYGGQAALTQTQEQELPASSLYSPYKRDNPVSGIVPGLQGSAKTPGAYASKYQEQIDALLAQVQGRTPFSYDAGSDPLYQFYSDRYQQLGQNAMQDTMGNAAALTGGYENSYASTAGNQAYQSYLQGLNDVVPQLEGAAYDRWQDKGNDNINRLALLQALEESDYGRYRDTVGDSQDAQSKLLSLYASNPELFASGYSGSLYGYGSGGDHDSGSGIGSRSGRVTQANYVGGRASRTPVPQSTNELGLEQALEANIKGLQRGSSVFDSLQEAQDYFEKDIYEMIQRGEISAEAGVNLFDKYFAQSEDEDKKKDN